MGGFSRSLLKQIRQVFPASDSSVNNPADVSDDVQFVADYLPPNLRLDRMSHESVLGDPNVLVVDLSVVPAERYWYVETAHVFHNGTGSQLLSIFIRNDNLGVAGLISSTRFVADGSGVDLNVLFPAHRAFLVPSGWRVRGAVSGLAAGARLDVSASFLELPVMEKSPQI